MRLLHLAVSARGDESHSRAVAAAFIDRLRGEVAGLQVTERDLARTPLPHPDAAFVRASLAWGAADMAGLPAGEPPQALALSEQLLDELAQADALLISTPMHNFTVPSALKAWIDLVVRPGRSFRNTPAGKQPCLRDRPVWVVVACGGPFGEAPAQTDFFTPYLRYVLAVVGLRRVEVLRLDSASRRGMAPPLVRAQDWIAAQAASVARS